MSITVGGQNVISIQWQRSGKGTVNQDITAWGVDGHAYQTDATRGDERPAMIVVDSANPKTTYDTFKGFQGTLITIVDDFGDTHTNVMMRNVSWVSCHYVKTAIGGVTNGSYLLRFSCTLTET